MTELCLLAKKYNTDKLIHGYTQIYQKLFEHIRNESFTFLELGVGGYENQFKGGESLYMWADFFPKATIHAIDIEKKSIKGNFYIHQIPQNDKKSLEKLIEKIGQPTIIIDDASHINPLTRKSFQILFPLLKQNGIYVIEDTQTSYKKEFLGDNINPKADTIINYMFSLINHTNQTNDEFNPKSIQFFKQLAIIYK